MRHRAVLLLAFASLASAETTYTRDISRIVQSHCQQCHRPNDIAPFALMTYDDVVTYADDIKANLTQKKMPPWKPTAGPVAFKDSYAISDDERSLFMVESDTDRVLRFELTGSDDLGPGDVYAEAVGRLPDGLALDEAGNLYVACYASDEVWRISSARQKTLLAWDHHAILLSRPTNLAWGGAEADVLYVANLGRTTITRARLPGVRGRLLANQF